MDVLDKFGWREYICYRIPVPSIQMAFLLHVVVDVSLIVQIDERI
jgi:hypothetical protein